MSLKTLKNKTSGETKFWIDIQNAQKEEIEYLKKKFNFSLQDLHDSFGKISAERLKFKENGNHFFMVMRFLILNDDREIVSEEVDFFIGKNYIITLHQGKLENIKHLFNLCKKDPDSSKNYFGTGPVDLFYNILNEIYLNSLQLMDLISKKINETEKNIFSGLQRESIDDILIIKRNIINARKIMQPHKNALKKVTGQKIVKMNDQKYFDLISQTKDIWDILEGHKEMIEALEYTNDSMLSYKMEDVMKTLTIFSVVVFPLTLLAAIFGMNTISGMPFINHPFGFWIVIWIMALGVLIMFGWFKKKGWL